MTRLAAALLLLALPCLSQTPAQQAADLVRQASRALQAGNAARFLGYVDPDAENFRALRQELTALLATHSVASSVDVIIESESEQEVRLTADWLLQVTHQTAPGPIEQRRQKVSLVVRLGGEPRITAIAPTAFFGPKPLVAP